MNTSLGEKIQLLFLQSQTLIIGSLVAFLFLNFISISKIYAQSTIDTLQIVKISEGSFGLDLYQGADTASDFRMLILLDSEGNTINGLDMWQYQINMESNSIVLPLVFYTNWFNQDFYASNFPWIASSIDTSRFYNRIDVGKIVGSLTDEGIFEYEFIFNEAPYLMHLNLVEIRKTFDELSKDMRYSSWNCGAEKFKEACVVFEQITWATLMHNTLSKNEYLTLIESMVPCLGPENGEDFLFFRQLIWLIK